MGYNPPFTNFLGHPTWNIETFGYHATTMPKKRRFTWKTIRKLETVLVDLDRVNMGEATRIIWEMVGETPKKPCRHVQLSFFYIFKYFPRIEYVFI